jgi:hypothetical protein
MIKDLFIPDSSTIPLNDTHSLIPSDLCSGLRLAGRESNVSNTHFAISSACIAFSKHAEDGQFLSLIVFDGRTLDST